MLLQNAVCADKWLSVREAAEELGVNHNAAFRWRHVIIGALRQTPNATDITAALGQELRADAPLVIDSSPACLTVGRSLGVAASQLPCGAHTLGPDHIQM